MGIVVALLILAGWAMATFAFAAPGWVHVFLSVGVFLLIYRIVLRGDPVRPSRPDDR